MYQRPDGTFLNFESMLKSDFSAAALHNIKLTTPAATAAVPQIAAAVQEYTPVNVSAQPTVVCSGTVLVQGDTVGIAMNDEVAAATGSMYCTEAAEIVVPLDSGATVALGADVYVIAASGLFTSVSAGNVWCGKFLEAAARATENGLPAHGDGYALIRFSQDQV